MFSNMLNGWFSHGSFLGSPITSATSIASGRLTVRELEHGPVEIVDLPIKHGDFP